MNTKLFVYGTLLDEDNKYGIFLRDNSRFFSKGKVRGSLYEIGEYPAATLDPDSNDYVYGIILQMDEAETVLPMIDMYEGFGADQPQPNEFIRVLTEAITDNGPVACW
ncbi:MAG TPA: gamma-glutamylcyclotransferase family protein, partial [Mucilaginibacter sp.]